MNNWVNGELVCFFIEYMFNGLYIGVFVVIWFLGDVFMKEFVVGVLYIIEIILDE